MQSNRQTRSVGVPPQEIAVNLCVTVTCTRKASFCKFGDAKLRCCALSERRAVQRVFPDAEPSRISKAIRNLLITGWLYFHDRRPPIRIGSSNHSDSAQPGTLRWL